MHPYKNIQTEILAKQWLKTLIPSSQKLVCFIGMAAVDLEVRTSKRQRLLDLYKQKMMYRRYMSTKTSDQPSTPRVDLKTKKDWERALHVLVEDSHEGMSVSIL